jgi:hypothetical protein
MQMTTFLQRVHSATEIPTLYFLGKGGWPQSRRGEHAQPGELVSPAACLAGMPAEKLTRYEEALTAAGLSPAEFRPMPRSPACDCTRFVAWALDVPHDVQPDGEPGSFYTGSILDDVRRAKRMFEPFDAAVPGRAAPGTMLVYASRSAHEVGHIGVVTEVDGTGRPTRIIHCAPENYLAPPLPGCARNAIRETAVAPFFTFDGANPAIVVRCKLLTT